MATWYVDFTAGTNGSGTSAGSPLNSPSAIVSAAPAAGDVVYCKGPLSGTLALSTLAGSSLANPVTFIGVTNLSTLDMSSKTQINASGQSAALTGSGNSLHFRNFDFRNSTSTTNQHSGNYLVFVDCVFHKGTGSAGSAASVFDSFFRGCKFYNYTSTALTLAGTYASAAEECYFEGCSAGIVTGGYRNCAISNCVFVSITNDAISYPGNAIPGTPYGIFNCTFYSIGGSAIVFDGAGHGDVLVEFNLFVSVTGTCIKLTNSPSGSTVISAFGNKAYSVGTFVGTNVKNSGQNDTLGSDPLTSAPSDVTVTSASGLRGTHFNQASFGGMQIGNPSGGGSFALLPTGMGGGFQQ
mgnify:CR=1 FL=1